MQREIKFRGKRMDNNEWSFGNIVKSGHNIFIVYDATEDDYKYAFENVFIQVLPETVGQYIGLRDKNGVDIYEGDIIKDLGQNFPCVITYDQLLASFTREFKYDRKVEKIRFLSSSFHFLEVIGNIHENKHLIENDNRN